MPTKKNKLTGTLGDVPYDFRKPTKERFESRVWNPKGPFIARRWFGWGYDFNMYAVFHPIKWRQARSKAKK